MKFTCFKQLESVDCGPTCIRMVSAFYGRRYRLNTLKEYCGITRIGVSVQDIIEGCDNIGLKTAAIQIDYEKLKKMPLPAILCWRQEHFVVLYERVKRKDRYLFRIADPQHGKVTLDEKEFLLNWIGKEEKGIVVLAEPTDRFYEYKGENETFSDRYRSFIIFIRGNFNKYKNRLGIVTFLSLFAVAANWASPVIFQKIVDIGIGSKSMHIVLLLALLQLALFLGYMISGTIGNLIQTKIGFKISIEMLSKYLHKLIRLPIKFFDVKLNTDLIQRVEDQARIDRFLTYSLNTILLNVLNYIVFSLILLYYNVYIFLVFLVFMVISFTYSMLFWKKRAVLDYRLFSILSNDKSNVYELIDGMTEVKINNAQHTRIKKWQKTQDQANGVRLKRLIIDYYSSVGVEFLSRLRDIIIIVGCAYYVIEGNMSIGVMMTIIFIMGQLSGYASAIINFFVTLQDTKLSFDRMQEIYNTKDENSEKRCSEIADMDEGIAIQRVCFKYPGNYNKYVLRDIDLKIKKGTVTAIVGASGSGKSTLVKMLLAFYRPQEGRICVDGNDLCDLNSDQWRSRCGVVMQDGYIFSGTIVENIALSDENPDMRMVVEAARIACIADFVDSLPMKYNTKIGSSGISLSGGQMQRMLIARAVYKNPEILFFDEATSSLDANNEKEIMYNLNRFFKDKTVIIVAHRLSTVKNADNIIYMENGRIIEEGTNEELTRIKGAYYNLVKNQLELGN